MKDKYKVIDLKKLKAKMENDELTSEEILQLQNIIETNRNGIKGATYASVFEWMESNPSIQYVDTKLVYSLYFNWCNSKNMRPLNANMLARILNNSFGYKSQVFTIDKKSVRKYIKAQ